MRAIAMATELDQLEIQAHAWNNVGTALYDKGDPMGKPMLEKSLRLSLDNGFGEHVSRAYSNLISSATVARDYASAQRWLQESAKYFADRDLDAWSNYVLGWQARVNFEQGRWDDAARLAGALIGRSSVANISRIPALTVLARLRHLRGDPGSRTLLEEATTLALGAGELQRLAPVAAAIAEAAWLEDDATAPHPMLQSTYELAIRQGKIRATGELGYWRQQLSISIDTQCDVEKPYALQLSGHWRAASDAWQALGCPYERAHALMHGDEAGMRDALALFEKLGAAAAAKRCREKLRKAGIRGVARGPRASTAKNVAGLTSRELQIIILLAQGLSNAAIAGRLVRSEKTIDHHVSTIYRKLEVHSRHAAVTKANRLGVIVSN
jgi:DNA-binding CsgD family transcriptional regulator